MKQANSGKFRLAGVDLDGTLLGPDTRIGDENRRAVARLQAAGVEVALASGRHYDSILPYAESLGGMRWMVSAQGGEVSDLGRARVLGRWFLNAGHAREALELGRAWGLAVVVYSENDVFANGLESEEAGLRDYEALCGRRLVRVDDAALLARNIFKICWDGEPAAIDRALASPLLERTRAAKVRTSGRMLEFVPPGASKGAAMAALAAHLGVDAADALGFGDGDNDAPFFQWAGVSVAMPHGTDKARRTATFTAPEGPPKSAFARGVESLMARFPERF
ncbi:MAG: HAD-IIB family hydrolase [Opitutaceae bacterium]|jgi:Cof subfamily protein (haloacid dehalogenase superfamily)|nr:HAD-IIB family hydrolase [Opitutaceae bacterium]